MELEHQWNMGKLFSKATPYLITFPTYLDSYLRKLLEKGGEIIVNKSRQEVFIRWDLNMDFVKGIVWINRICGGRIDGSSGKEK